MVMMVMVMMKEDARHLVPVEHHQGLDNEDGGRRKGSGQ